MKQKFSAERLLDSEVAYPLAILESNRLECESIDKFHARRRPIGTGRAQLEKGTSAPKTMHDYAADNPILRELLRELQGK